MWFRKRDEYNDQVTRMTDTRLAQITSYLLVEDQKVKKKQRIKRFKRRCGFQIKLFGEIQDVSVSSRA